MWGPASCNYKNTSCTIRRASRDALDPEGSIRTPKAELFTTRREYTMPKTTNDSVPSGVEYRKPQHSTERHIKTEVQVFTQFASAAFGQAQRVRNLCQML